MPLPLLLLTLAAVIGTPSVYEYVVSIVNVLVTIGVARLLEIISDDLYEFTDKLGILALPTDSPDTVFGISVKKKTAFPPTSETLGRPIST